jgi:ribosomal protein S18 acetylase RimI-like enzyme
VRVFTWFGRANSHSFASHTSMSTTLVTTPSGYIFKDLTALTSKDRRPAVVDKVAKLERKVFPSSEGFDYNVELKKKNIGLVLAFTDGGDENDIVAYLVYQRIKRLVWLHKLCVMENARRKGIGRALVHALQCQMAKGGGEKIHLWVDEHREPARALYDSCGFQQIEHRPDYYAIGRAGLKLELPIID